MPNDETLNPQRLEVLFEQLVEQARQHAWNSGEIPVAAAVLHGGQVIAVGLNTRETDHDPTGHAEINAIKLASKKVGSWKLQDCILLTTLEPCLMCLASVQAARIAHVVYGSKDPKGGALSLGFSFHGDPRLNHRFSVSYHEHLPSGKLLSDFFATLRKKKKRESS